VNGRIGICVFGFEESGGAVYVICRRVGVPDGTDALISHAFEVRVLELYQLFVRVFEW